MNGFDYILLGVGIVGLIATAIAVAARRPLAETAAIGVGSLGAALIGTGGLSDQTWLLGLGVLLLLGAVGYEWFVQPKKGVETEKDDIKQ